LGNKFPRQRLRAVIKELAGECVRPLESLELAAFSQTGDEINNGVLRVQMTEQQIHEVPISICVDTRPMRIGVGRFLCQPLFGTPTYQQERPDIAEQVLQLAAEIESLHNHRDSHTDLRLFVETVDAAILCVPLRRMFHQPERPPWVIRSHRPGV